MVSERSLILDAGQVKQKIRRMAYEIYEHNFNEKTIIMAGIEGQPPSDQPYFEFQVEKQVQQIPGTGNLRYPDMLRSANVEGEVLAQFVVDADGRYEAGTFKVLKSSHELFTQAVKNALPNMRFYAAEVGGKKVKQLVQQPFTFSLTKGD